jgi:hypothetical protein
VRIPPPFKRGSEYATSVLESKEHAIAFSRFLPAEATHTLRIIGQSFKPNGNVGAEWKSVAVGIQEDQKKIVYSWEGSHPADHPGEAFKGFGEIEFEDAKGTYLRARGHFADIHLVHMETTIWKSTELRRAGESRADREGPGGVVTPHGSYPQTADPRNRYRRQGAIGTAMSQLYSTVVES